MPKPPSFRAHPIFAFKQDISVLRTMSSLTEIPTFHGIYNPPVPLLTSSLQLQEFPLTAGCADSSRRLPPAVVIYTWPSNLRDCLGVVDQILLTSKGLGIRTYSDLMTQTIGHVSSITAKKAVTGLCLEILTMETPVKNNNPDLNSVWRIVLTFFNEKKIGVNVYGNQSLPVSLYETCRTSRTFGMECALPNLWTLSQMSTFDIGSEICLTSSDGVGTANPRPYQRVLIGTYGLCVDYREEKENRHLYEELSNVMVETPSGSPETTSSPTGVIPSRSKGIEPPSLTLQESSLGSTCSTLPYSPKRQKVD